MTIFPNLAGDNYVIEIIAVSLLATAVSVSVFKSIKPIVKFHPNGDKVKRIGLLNGKLVARSTSALEFSKKLSR